MKYDVSTRAYFTKLYRRLRLDKSGKPNGMTDMAAMRMIRRDIKKGIQDARILPLMNATHEKLRDRLLLPNNQQRWVHPECLGLKLSTLTNAPHGDIKGPIPASERLRNLKNIERHHLVRQAQERGRILREGGITPEMWADL